MQGTKKDKPQVRSFLESVTVKGVPKIVKAPSKCQQALWLLAVLFGTGVATFQLYSVISGHLSYSSSISFTQTTETATFPDVTICNLNPLWVGDFRGNYNYTMEDMSYGTLAELWNVLVNRPELVGLILPLLSTGGYLQNLDSQTLMKQTEEADLFVVDCSWLYLDRQVDNGECKSRVKLVYTPDYGPCFTFQNEIDASSRGEGLHVPVKLTTVLYLNNFQEEVLSNFFVNPSGTYANGARVLVHPRGTFPEMTDGVNVSPGTEVTFRLQAEKYKLLGMPYTDCDRLQEDIQTRDQNYTYTSTTCTSMCWQREVLKTCGCLDHRLITLPEQYEEYDYCGKVYHSDYNITYGYQNCSEAVVDYLVQNTEDMCSCNKACRWAVYDTDVFQAPWPHEAFHLSFFYNVIYYHPQISWRFVDFANEAMTLLHVDRTKLYEKLRSDTIITRNFLQVNVELKVNSTHSYSEVSLSSFASMMGNIGGILNLWVGITFITVIECVDFIYALLMDKTRPWNRERKVGTPDQMPKGRKDFGNSVSSVKPVVAFHDHFPSGSDEPSQMKY